MSGDKNILITGSTGFVGSRLVKLFEEDYSLTRCSLQTMKVEDVNFSGIDVVIHLAGLAHRMTPPPDSLFFEVNSDLTKNLAESAKAGGVKHFIYMSSTKVYNDALELVDLSTPCEPKDAYGKSKVKAEESLRTIESHDFVVSIIRPPLIYGPGVKGNVRKLIELAGKMKFIPLGGIDNRRSMVNVDNLIQLVNLLIQKSQSGTFLVQDEKPVSTSDLIGEIIRNSDSKARLIRIPKILQKLAHKIVPDKAKRLFGSFEVDDSFTRKTISYAPEVPFGKGIDTMIN